MWGDIYQTQQYQLSTTHHTLSPSQSSSIKRITLSHLCGVERKWSPFSADSVCVSHYLAQLLFQCSLLCRCQVAYCAKKWWQAISKTVHPLLSVSQASDQTVLHSKLYFFSFRCELCSHRGRWLLERCLFLTRRIGRNKFSHTLVSVSRSLTSCDVLFQ